jgi:hypothetical protein
VDTADLDPGLAWTAIKERKYDIENEKDHKTVTTN